MPETNSENRSPWVSLYNALRFGFVPIDGFGSDRCSVAVAVDAVFGSVVGCGFGCGCDCDCCLLSSLLELLSLSLLAVSASALFDVLEGVPELVGEEVVDEGALRSIRSLTTFIELLPFSWLD